MAWPRSKGLRSIHLFSVELKNGLLVLWRKKTRESGVKSLSKDAHSAHETTLNSGIKLALQRAESSAFTTKDAIAPTCRLIQVQNKWSAGIDSWVKYFLTLQHACGLGNRGLSPCYCWSIAMMQPLVTRRLSHDDPQIFKFLLCDCSLHRSMDRLSNRQSRRSWSRQVHRGAWVQMAASTNQHEKCDSVA